MKKLNKKDYVLFTHKIPDLGINIIKEHCDIIILEENLPLKSQLEEYLPNAKYLVSLLSVNIDENIIQLGTRLKAIANYAVGYNNIDIKTAQKKNILVTNTPDVLTNATADLIWGLILAVTRRIVEGDLVCRENTFKGWKPEYMLGFEVTGETIGIVGMGRIGEAVAKRASGFDMKIMYYSRTRKKDLETKYNLVYKETLSELLGEADIVSLNIPYTKETHHLISKKELDSMKNSAYLINTSRGRVIEENDLITALKSKSIAGAALDVFYNEPSIPKTLRDLSNVVLTPHIGSATKNARNAMAKKVNKTDTP